MSFLLFPVFVCVRQLGWMERSAYRSRLAFSRFRILQTVHSQAISEAGIDVDFDPARGMDFQNRPPGYALAWPLVVA
jgi:hypothetical protein